MSYRPSVADPDVWMKSAVKPNGEKYYEYALAYVDDILTIGMEPEHTMNQIQEKFKLKNDKVAPPDDYLGAVLKLVKNDRGEFVWSQSSDKYVKASVENVEAKLKSLKKGLRTRKQSTTPFISTYKPELDVSPELKHEGHRYYQELIGVLRWAIELGRLDILLEVSLLSAFLACPRVGHLDAVLQIFSYLKWNPKRKLLLDGSYPRIKNYFPKDDWFDFYRDAKEAVPPNAPKPRGKPVSTHCFVDAGHAGDKTTRRSQTGVLIFLNRAPVVWYSKRSNTVETSSFGAEIVSVKTATEMVISLRYKLRMFGVPLEGPTDMYCDNQAVVLNCTTPESQLKKKHHSVAYHFNRQAVATGTIRLAHELGETNLADLFTKVLGVIRRNKLLDAFMF
jgi:hypothetical protein